MKMNLWDPLSRHLTAFQLHLIEQVSDAAGRLKMPIYIVGGVVRDLLLDRPINDLDIVVEGDAIRLGKEVVSLYQGRLVTHPQFFTANWESEEDPDPDIPIEGWGPRMSLDLISARSEIYPSPAVLPEVRMGSIEDDLQRRDFTLNTLAVRLDGVHRGELLDRCGGLQDLKDGILRTLHERSFIDDPTRIFRGIRFEGRFGFAFGATSAGGVSTISAWGHSHHVAATAKTATPDRTPHPQTGNRCTDNVPRGERDLPSCNVRGTMPRALSCAKASVRFCAPISHCSFAPALLRYVYVKVIVSFL